MKSPLLLVGCLLLGATSTAAGGPSSEGDRSSHVPQFHNAAQHAGADPYVFFDYKSGRYYAYSTEGADDGYLFAIYSSPDLSTWHKQPGGALRACYDANGTKVAGGQACWAGDWYWAPETYYNEKTGWYFFFFAGRLRPDLTKDHFRYSEFEEPSKIGVAVSRSPLGPFREIEPKPIPWFPFDPNYHDVNLVMDDLQMLPPQTQAEGETAPKGTYIPTIDVNIFFDLDGRIFLYASRNAYRNWNWDSKLGKYIEESNIIVVELAREWWDDPTATTMPAITPSEVNIHADHAPQLPGNITSYNATGDIGDPPRKDGWQTVISYGADPQDWENFHVDDYKKYNGTRKDRRWSEGSTVITRSDSKVGSSKQIYLLTYSANNYEATYYGVGFATAESPFGPFRKSSNNPILSQEPNGTVPVHSTGHGSIVASPPRPGSYSYIGAQQVTHNTPDGSELFYVHHARNNTSSNRSLYTTRMTLNESAIHFQSNQAINMHLSPMDELLPRHTYPVDLDVVCFSSGKREGRIYVRVSSRIGAGFDIREITNRVVALPGWERPNFVQPLGKEASSFIVGFGVDKIETLAYQRQLLDGSWTTVAEKSILCY